MPDQLQMDSCYRVEFSKIKIRLISGLWLLMIVFICIPVVLTPIFLILSEHSAEQTISTDTWVLTGLVLLIMTPLWVVWRMVRKIAKLSKARVPMAILTPDGIEGYDFWMRHKKLSWEDVDGLIAPDKTGAWLFQENHPGPHTFWQMVIRQFWNPQPNSVIIRGPFSRTKIQDVKKAFFHLNPYSEERFSGKWTSRLIR